MSVYISEYLESKELYYVEISDENNVFYAYMSKSELEDCHCVVNPEKMK